MPSHSYKGYPGVCTIGKQDVTIAKQEAMDKRLAEIQADCQRIARTNGGLAGAVSGAVSGGVVATGIAFIRAKFGF